MTQADILARSRIPLPGVLLALVLVVTVLALTAVEARGASLRIFWRLVVLSFDHPSTQLLDEMAGACSAATADGSDARSFTRCIPSGRFVPAREAGRRAAFVLSAGITRAPPTA